MFETTGVAEGEQWGDRPVSRAQVDRFLAQAHVDEASLETAAKMLLEFPVEYRVRGVFFEGEARLVTQRSGPDAWREVLRSAGAPPRITPFGSYVFRDLYKVHALTARTLWPAQPLPQGLANISRKLYPIFRESLVGKTMSALYAPEPATFLRILCESYRISVVGNTHNVRVAGEREVRWSATVEPNPWFPLLFGGIVEGALETQGLPGVKVTTLEARTDRVPYHFEFKITW